MNRFSMLFFLDFMMLTVMVFVPSCSDSEDVTSSGAYGYKVINTFAHDRKAFTQGLVFENGILYEGTGLYGRSELRKIDLRTGNILQTRKLPPEFFGEGITIYGNSIIQLTFRSNVGFVYDKNSLELLQEFNYPTEGWGITHNGRYLIMSDGTPTLYFLDPETFEQVRLIRVYDHNVPVWGINELEYVQGQIYANIWPTERIARIALDTGRVTGWIDMEGLLARQNHTEYVDVLNGIAYDKENDRLFVTGKFWPKLFEIKLIPTK